MTFHEYPYTDFHEMNLDWVIAKVKELTLAWAQTSSDWEELRTFVNDYFANLNVQTEINNKLDELASDGTLAELMAPYVASGLPAVVADQIAAVVADQIGAVVAAQLPAKVAEQLPAAVAGEAANWLSTHVDPETGYVIDDSLTIAGAAADAKATGDRLTELSDSLELTQNNMFALARGYLKIDKGLFRKGYFKDGGVVFDEMRWVAGPFPVKVGDTIDIVSDQIYSQSYVADENNNILARLNGGASAYTKPTTTFTIQYDGYFYVNVRNAAYQGDATTITQNDIDVELTAYITLARQNELAIAELNESKSFEIILDSHIVLVDGTPLFLYFQNVLLGLNADKIHDAFLTYYGAIDGLSMAILNARPNSSGNEGYLKIFPENNLKDVSKFYHSTWLQSSVGSGLNKKVMLIGDSLTWNGYSLSALIDLFENDSMSIESVGTVHTSGNHNGFYHEGRSGWSAYDYIHTESSETAGGVHFDNAFFNPVTREFDFNYYVSQTSIIPDYIIICLGTNDVGRDDVATNLEAMITSIQGYYQTNELSVRIGVWMPPTRALYANNNFTSYNAALETDKMILDAFEDRESEKIYIVPALNVIDPKHDFPSTPEFYDRYNSNLSYEKSTDSIHPKLSGYQKLADLLFTYIKYFGYLDQQ